MTYGTVQDADFRAENLIFNQNCSEYDLIHKEEKQGKIKLNVPGKHNVLNSLAAISLGLELGISMKNLKKSWNYRFFLNTH